MYQWTCRKPAAYVGLYSIIYYIIINVRGDSPNNVYRGLHVLVYAYIRYKLYIIIIIIKYASDLCFIPVGNR